MFARRDADAARFQLSEAREQLGVLLSAVEAIEAGGAGEAQQALVSACAQLAAARAREAGLERRAADLLVGLEGAVGLWWGAAAIRARRSCRPAATGLVHAPPA